MTPQETLLDYSQRAGVNPEAVVALKLRPTMEGAHYTDTFGFQDANAYLNGSEYKVLRDGLISAGWKVRTEGYNRELYEGQNITWTLVEHESGPEILGTIEAVVSIAAGLITIFDFVRKRIDANKKDQKSDRYHNKVYKIRIEMRRLNKEGILEETLITNMPIQDALPAKQALTKIKSILKKL